MAPCTWCSSKCGLPWGSLLSVSISLPCLGSFGCVFMALWGHLWMCGLVNPGVTRRPLHGPLWTAPAPRPVPCLGAAQLLLAVPGNSLIRPSRVFSDGGGRRCVGLLGETRSPENQQSRGTCPGAPAPGNLERQDGRGWQREQRQRKNMLWPLLLALGRHCPHLSPGGWATALISFA